MDPILGLSICSITYGVGMLIKQYRLARLRSKPEVQNAIKQLYKPEVEQ